MKKKKPQMGSHPLLLIGFFLSVPMAVMFLISTVRHHTRHDHTCESCQKVQETKAAVKAGDISKTQALGRELDILASKYYERRLLKLEEKRQLTESEEGSTGDLLETKLDIARARWVLGEDDESAFRAERTALLTAYEKWLGKKVAAGEINPKESRRRLDLIELR